MNNTFKIVVGLLFIGLSSAPVMSDEIIMTTGERFISSDIWQEGDKIRFNMQGLVVSVDRADVAQIIRQNQGDKHSSQDQNSDDKTSTDSTLPLSNPVDNRKNITLPPEEKNSHPNDFDYPQRPQEKKRNRTSRASGEKGIGIAGVTWQMPRSRLADLEKIETDPAFGGIDQYWQPTQPLAYNGTPVDGLIYGFWQDKLYSIMIWADGRIGYNSLKQTVFRNFGPGSQNAPQSERFVWDGDQTQRMLEFDSERNKGIFVMRSAELDKKIKTIYPSSHND